MGWTAADIPDQTGRTAVVTGSNTGLGLETAAVLAAKGATTVLACRDQAKAAAARDDILRRTPGVAVELLRLDLGDLSQVAEAAAETRERFGRIDLLINNAGVMIPPRSTTTDGFELQFGTNHLGHFAYTAQVWPAVRDTAGSRVVSVASLAHRAGRMRWDDLAWERSYNRMRAYGMSKLSNLLFAFELQRRLDSADTDTISLAAHPGASATELVRYFPGASAPGVKQIIGAATAVFAQPADRGALPTLRAATDPAAAGYEYYGPKGPGELRGLPVLVQPQLHARDQADWARLWTVSEELTGVTFAP